MEEGRGRGERERAKVKMDRRGAGGSRGGEGCRKDRFGDGLKVMDKEMGLTEYKQGGKGQVRG